MTEQQDQKAEQGTEVVIGDRCEKQRDRRTARGCGSRLTVAKTARDEDVIRAAYSLGYATGGTLRELVSPTTGLDTFTARLRLLYRARYLTRLRVVDQLRHTYLYG